MTVTINPNRYRATGLKRNSQPLWRGRRGKPESSKRVPFSATVPKSWKVEPHPAVIAISAHIRAAAHDLAAEDRAYIRGKLGRALGKFADHIVRASVRTEDTNGPRGGVDRVCRIKIVLIGLPSVVFEKRDPTLNAAVDGAISGVEQAVRRGLQRRRTKPRRATFS
jgi:ribosome-associated translation inhibitor RaiA